MKGVHGRRIAEVGSKEAIAGVEILKGEIDKEKGHLSPRVTIAERRAIQRLGQQRLSATERWLSG